MLHKFPTFTKIKIVYILFELGVDYKINIRQFIRSA